MSTEQRVTQEPARTSSGSTTRRSIVTAGAWSVPVIATGLAAPSVAASLEPGPTPDLAIDGWVNFFRLGDDSLRWDARGAYPDRGFWVVGSDGTETVTNVSLTIWYDRPITSSFVPAEGNAGLWTTPTPIGTNNITGNIVWGYRTNYLGGTTVHPNGVTILADNNFHFVTGPNVAGGTIRFWAQRIATVNGEVISFVRGPAQWG